VPGEGADENILTKGEAVAEKSKKLNTEDIHDLFSVHHNTSVTISRGLDKFCSVSTGDSTKNSRMILTELFSRERERERERRDEKYGKYLDLLNDRWHLKNDSLLLS